MVESLNNNLIHCFESLLKDTSKSIENDQERKLINNLINAIKTKPMNVDTFSTKYVKNAILNVLKQEKYGYGIIDLKNYEDTKNLQLKNQAEKTFDALSNVKRYFKNMEKEYNEKIQSYEDKIKDLKAKIDDLEWDKNKSIKDKERKIKRLERKIDKYEKEISKLDDELEKLHRNYLNLEVKFFDLYYSVINVITYILIYFIMTFILYLLLRLIMGKKYRVKYSEILLLKPNFFKTIINFFKDKNISGGKKSYCL